MQIKNLSHGSWMISFIKEMNFWWANIITHNKIIFDLQQCRFYSIFYQMQIKEFPMAMNEFID